MSGGQSAERQPPKVLVWAWLSVAGALAIVGAILGYRVTGTFLGAAAGWFSVAIIAGFAQFVLVVVGAIRGMRSHR